ncbi:MAG TPA: hypothetical protein VFK07_02025 [Candidatus Paceibacterota bacterium]|nr:hypothetical protein [Candidatus Paceibacterota bacterium]
MEWPQELALAKQEKRITEFVRAEFGPNPEPFNPHATYDGESDWIMVQVRDCNFHKTWGDGVLYLLKDNYPKQDQEQCVGFGIYFAGAFCRHFGLITDAGDVDLNEVLDALQFVPNNDPHKTEQARNCLKHLSATVLNIS